MVRTRLTAPVCPQIAPLSLHGITARLPPTVDDRREIVAVLDAIDRRIDLRHHKRAGRRRSLQGALHKPMTGEFRVHRGRDVKVQHLRGHDARRPGAPSCNCHIN